MKRALAAASFLASAAAACPPEDAVPSRDDRSTELPRPRDGNVAIRQELEAARRAGTVEAYDLFLARHPRHPLAATARRERDRIARPR